MTKYQIPKQRRWHDEQKRKAFTHTAAVSYTINRGGGELLFYSYRHTTILVSVQALYGNELFMNGILRTAIRSAVQTVGSSNGSTAAAPPLF